MEIKIVSQKYNPLLKRKEVAFKVEHEKVGGTPPRLEIKAKLAQMLKMKLEQVYVRKVETKTGTRIALGEACGYDTVEQAILIEPKYIIERNTPKDKAEEAEKPKKAEKAEEPKKPEKPVEEGKEVKEAGGTEELEKAETVEKAENSEEAKPPKEKEE